MKTTVTRRTQMGFAVNTNPTQDNPGYHFELPTTPGWTGTYNTVSQQMHIDPYLNSLTNTFYSSAWFVKVGGTWMRVANKDEFGWVMGRLHEKYDWGFGMKYISDQEEIEVEYPTAAAAAAAELGKIRSEKKANSSRENGKGGGRPKKNN